MVIIMYIIVDNKKINIVLAKHFLTRLKGFMFKKNINYCLCFPKCNSIHTFFMLENINIIMADKNNKILYIYNNVKKNKIIFPKKNVFNTYELPVNINNTYKVNDYIKIKDD